MINQNISYPKFSEFKNKNVTRCPIYDCFKPFSTVSQLKNHMTRFHKDLLEYGIEISSNGKIKWPKEHIDHIARLIRYYPDFVVKHVRAVGDAKLLD